MLQRELTRQKRASDFTYDEVGKEKTLIKSKDESSERQPEQSPPSLISDKSTGKLQRLLINANVRFVLFPHFGRTILDYVCSYLFTRFNR